MRQILLFLAWAIAAIAFFFILVYAGEYSKEQCELNGGKYVQGTWSKECRK